MGNSLEIGVDDGFAFRIERARRFVQDQDTRINDEGAGNRQSLSMPTAERLGEPS